MKQSAAIGTLFGVLPLCLAQFAATPTGLTVTDSKVNDQVKISYKKTEICETTKGVSSFAGYVHMPGSLLADVGGFNINTYFLYVEARHDAATAPLAIYFARGPGESSIYTALASESGPCYTGFSYDSLVIETYNLTEEVILPLTYNSSQAAYTDAMTSWGTFSSQDPSHTTNTTVSSGRAVWHFAEHWLSSFPEYKTLSTKLGIWGNSYGGLWAPEVAARLSKNLKSLPAKHPLKAKRLAVDTLGVTNGCIDFENILPGFVEYAYNNTYGVRFLSESKYNHVMDNLTSAGGVLDAVKTCRALGEQGDPDFMGNNQTVNEVCIEALSQALLDIGASAAPNNRSAFDIVVHQPDAYPFDVAVTNYINLPQVQQALAAPLNFTYNSNLINGVFGLPSPYSFMGTGDFVRYSGILNIKYLLANGVKIALVFGDRDYRYPWIGGEAVAKTAKWTHQSGFLQAGYEKIQGITSGD